MKVIVLLIISISFTSLVLSKSDSSNSTSKKSIVAVKEDTSKTIQNSNSVSGKIGTDNINRINTTDWLQAIGTIGAVIIALFFYFWDRIREWWNKPRLKVSLQFNPPDCHRITSIDKTEDGRVISCEAYWFRMTVINTGRSSARDLEVIISNMKYEDEQVWKTYSPFLPSNLIWTHTSSQYLPLLLPKTEKKIDLGHIIDPKFRRAFQKEKNPLFNPRNQVLFHFEVCVQPTNGYNNVRSGKYKFNISVGAANSSPVNTTVELSFTGQWSLNETQMLEKEILIKIIN